MKKIIHFTLAGVIGAAAVSASVVALVKSGENKDLAANASQVGSLAITEVAADPMQVEFASLDKAKPDAVVRDTSDVYEFIEVHNYGETSVNLKNYALKITVNGKAYQNAFLFEDGNDGILEQGETCVIFNFTTSSFAYGKNDEYSMNYDTAENLAATWANFNDFYGVAIPITNRVMALAADTAGKAITGASTLSNTGECTVQIVEKDNGNTITKVDYSISTMGLSHNYVYETLGGEGAFFCVNGVTPYKLLREQDPDYSATYDFSGEKIRVINYNLLFTGYSFASRASCFKDFLTTYQPDVMALQEIATEWYAYLHEILPALGYSYVEVTVQTGGTVPTYHSDSSNPIIYKTDKFDLVATGGTFVSETGEMGGPKWDSVNRDRTINYAVLKSKATGNTFNVLSTHGILTGDQAKIEHGNMAVALANKITAQYGCPSFIMGDMNMNEGSKYYQNMVNGTGYVDSKYVAKNSSYRLTGAGFGRWPYGATDKAAPWNQEPSTIDYVFAPNGTQVENYKVIDQEYYNVEFSELYSDRGCHISDHSAVLVDWYM